MKTGQYTARIEARRAELLALEEAGVVVPKPDYDAMFEAHERAVEDRVEEVICDSFGGYDASVRAVDTKMVGQHAMTGAEIAK